MSTHLTFHQGVLRPSASLWLEDDDGTLIDFSTSGYTFTFAVGIPATTALLTKTTGITGAAGAGVDPSGTPNVTVAWASGDLSFAVGTYRYWLTATISGAPRIFEGPFTLLAVPA